MSKHAVGSTWMATNSQKDKNCYIWLSGRKKDKEIWIWKIVNNADSILDAGIGTSYNYCLKNADFNSKSESKVIFKKIK